MLAESEGILRAVGAARDQVHVLSCDAAVHTVQQVTSARQITLLGGGGTDIGAGIEACQDLHPRPGVVVVLTDGYTPWPSEPPSGMAFVIALLGDGPAPPPSWAAATVRVDRDH